MDTREGIERLLITYLANALWMTCLVAAAAALVARLIRQGPSAYRHALWVMALGCASLLPLTSLRNSSATGRDASAASVQDAQASSNPTGLTDAAGTLSPDSFWNKMRHGKRPLPFAPLLTEILAASYLGFLVLRGLSLCRAWHRTRRLRRGARARSFPPRQAAVLRRCLAAFDAGRVSIACSPALDSSPAVVGVRRPVLLLPESFFSDLAEEELASALCHELAHVRRHDFLLNLIYQALSLPVSFHPGALFIKAQMEQSRELACDETAAAALPTRAAYARSLVNIAQSLAGASSSTCASYALGLFDTNTLEERVMNLLKKTPRFDKTRARAQALAASGVLAAACLTASAFSLQVARAGSTPADLKQFAGTWEGKFQGKTFVTLKLAAKDGKISGTVSRFNIEMSPTGELTDASPSDGEDAISDTAPDGKVLHLITKAKGEVSAGGNDSEESIQYDMKLTGKDQAELQIVGAPPGMPAPAPWKLERKPAKDR